MENIKKTNFNLNQKKILGFIIGIVVILVLLAGLSNTPKQRITKQISLGYKFLEEQQYEEAIVVFNEVINLDKRCVEAYLGLAETYIRSSEFDKALEIAKQGYELTKDERLQEYINMIESGNISRSDGKVMKMTTYDEIGNVLFSHEYSYNKEGKMEYVAHYDSEHNFVSKIDFLYDSEGRGLVTYRYRGDNGEMTKGENIFENGVLAGTKWSDASWDKYEFDEQGKVIKEIWGSGENVGTEEEMIRYANYFYDENGRRVKREQYYKRSNSTFEMGDYQIWEYDGDKLVCYSIYNPDGTLMHYYLYEDGNMYQYDKDGNLVDYVMYE